MMTGQTRGLSVADGALEAANPLEAATALKAATLCEAFQITAATFPQRAALRTPGDAVVVTWEQYAERVHRTAAGLAALGVRRGDTVALMLTNRPEFHWVDVAAMHLGATSFGIYNTFSQQQMEHVLRDAGCAVVVTEQIFTEPLHRARLACPRLRHVVSVDGGESVLSLDEVDAAGDPGFELASVWPAVHPDDVVTLIYTSGTTGPPKAVQITHAGAIANARAMHRAMPGYRAGFSSVSYLPLTHGVARVVEHYGSLLLGGTLTCCADPDNLTAALVDTRPTWFAGYPSVWAALQADLVAAITAEPDDRRQRILQETIETRLRLVRAQQAGERLTAQVPAEDQQADALVRSTLRASLGLDRVETATIGAAPVPPGLIEFFWAVGVPLCEIYAMSELPGATVNPIDAVRIGTVGRALPGIELRLAEDGEVLLRGPSMMLGYRNLPEKTAEAIDAHGWLHSGDVGELDEDGYLRIIGRKDEMIINTAGHNMSPANVETHLRASSQLIGQAVCIGDGHPYNVALLVLDPDAAAGFAARHGLPTASLSALRRDRHVREEIAAGVARANARLSLEEQVRRWTLLDEQWLPGKDELTPTMKLQRRCIATKYAAEIAALYESDSPGQSSRSAGR
jgi:long-subunit acyl-CoA synthetase (AMP-forming)